MMSRIGILAGLLVAAAGVAHGVPGGFALLEPLVFSGGSFQGGVPEEKSFGIMSTVCINEVNAERQKVGKAPVQYVEPISRASNNHNNYMIQSNCFSHQCPGEEDPWQRMRSAGYTGSPSGEIIAAGSGSDSCAKAVQQWLNSPGHKAIMLGDSRQMGCAGTQGGSWGWYWTCGFGN